MLSPPATHYPAAPTRCSYSLLLLATPYSLLPTPYFLPYCAPMKPAIFQALPSLT